MNINEAFNAVIPDALPAGRFFVSLYRNDPYYGGPEEGGWWGNDTTLVSYKEFPTKEQADDVLELVKRMAQQQSREAEIAWGDWCGRTVDEAEARGLEASDLPEVDGPTSYFACVEETPGSHDCRGSRHYE